MGFPLFGNGRKTEVAENPGEKFLSRAHKFFPPKSGGKERGENSFTVIPRSGIKKKKTKRESAGVKKEERMRVESSKKKTERESAEVKKKERMRVE